ncbi:MULTISPECIES: hypothetical protein [unclassified Paenibacillus]|uniref:hypothetical protein n=1 Tax=unclassified Paenibacillus TaxID=185978 RepID=UPI00096EBC84|nr:MULTISPECIES: hypothetical protein [unclassified Paenibacillus]OMC68592.1 hypothetical protein BK126_12245 [Paenibacillus sp. FSL H7-0326]
MLVNQLHDHQSITREPRRDASTPADQAFHSHLDQAVLAAAVTTIPLRQRPTTKATAVGTKAMTTAEATRVHPIVALAPLNKFNHYGR